MGKKNVLLVNKADFLTKAQRKHWSSYFNSIGLSHAFYSAATAALKLKSEQKHEDESIPEDDEEDDEDEEESSGEEEKADGGDEGSGTSSNEEEEEVNHPWAHTRRHSEDEQDEDPDTKILSREQLIDFLRTFKASCTEEIFSVGLVGYPNVGKSSTINSLMDAKKTSVSATPGKTKHFQVCNMLVLEFLRVVINCWVAHL